MHTFTIELTSLLTDSSVMAHTSSSFIAQASIGSVHFAEESLECAVVFKSGELALYRLSRVAKEDVIYQEAEDKEVIIVEHVPVPNNRKYRPFFLLVPGLGAVTACALSDIGELFPCGYEA
jgi:syntaxin-binding protein 5